VRPTQPVLLPPEEAPRGALSPWVPWLAVLGVAVLGLVTVPATLERRRLDLVHARLVTDIRREEAALERLERLEREAGHAPYVRERELRRLLHPERAQR
jgi:hypothetical protein